MLSCLLKNFSCLQEKEFILNYFYSGNFLYVDLISKWIEKVASFWFAFFYKLKFQEMSCINVAALVVFKIIIIITIKTCSQKARKAFDVNRLSSVEAPGFVPTDTNLESVLTFHSGI